MFLLAFLFIASGEMLNKAHGKTTFEDCGKLRYIYIVGLINHLVNLLQTNVVSTSSPGKAA